MLPRILPAKVKCVVTRSAIDVIGVSPAARGVAETYSRLRAAQKPAARSAPAYSRFINRRLGRMIAAVAWSAGLTPNMLTAISAAFTGTAIVMLVTVPPGWELGVAVALLLLIGYAFDSADGQVARLSGLASPSGEWLDHVVDATKVAALPLALAIGLFRFEAVATMWLLVPVIASVVGSVLFFAMILTEQLRKQNTSVPLADAGGRSASSAGWARAVLVLPMDYGVLCLSFILLAWLPVFLVVYTAITAATAAFLLLAAAKWFTELRAAGPAAVR